MPFIYEIRNNDNVIEVTEFKADNKDRAWMIAWSRICDMMNSNKCYGRLTFIVAPLHKTVSYCDLANC